MPSLYSDIRKLAIPAIVSNITVPLLALVDTAIVGHLGDAAYIGAVAVGSLLLNVLAWLFGFLRMGTGGLTAQAYGRKDAVAAEHILLRSLLLGLLLAALMLVLRPWVMAAALALMQPSPAVAMHAAHYFGIALWGLPATLALYVFTGWFVGLQNGRFPMYVALVQNVANIALSFAFVYGAGWGMLGVAWGTVVAQYIGLGLAVGLYIRYLRYAAPYTAVYEALRQGKAWRELFGVNRDIFLRTLCLMAVTMSFTAMGTRQGDVVLAANALLLQFFMLFSYVMDGYAYAGEALAGRFLGAQDAKHFVLLVRVLFRIGVWTAVCFTLLYVLGGSLLLQVLTSEIQVRALAETYLPWVYAIPMVSFAAFLYDGIYIGTTRTRGMLQSMLVAMLAFFATLVLLYPLLANHALWAAQLIYLGTRGLMQRLLFVKVQRLWPEITQN